MNVDELITVLDEIWYRHPTAYKALAVVAIIASVLAIGAIEGALS